MRYYRVGEKFGKTHLCVEAGDGLLTSLTSINERVGEFRDLLDAGDITGNSVDAIARHLLEQGRGKEFELAQLIDWSISETGDARIIKPLEPDEMWAGGLGNMILTPEMLAGATDDVRLAYNTPEITTNFYKGTSHRLAGPFDRVGIRADTEYTIAEGELVLVIYRGKLAGYSTGNEVARRAGCPVGKLAGALQSVHRLCLGGSLHCHPREHTGPNVVGARAGPVPRWEGDCAKRGAGAPQTTARRDRRLHRCPRLAPPTWSFSTPEDSLRYPTSHSRREMSCESAWRESDSSRTLSRSSSGCVPVPTRHSATSSGSWLTALDGNEHTC